MKKTVQLLLLLALGQACYCQKSEIKKYNSKKFSDRNYFIKYDENGKIQVVQPSAPFYGSWQEVDGIIVIVKDKKETVTFNDVSGATLTSDVDLRNKQADHIGDIYFPEVLFPNCDLASTITDKKKKYLNRVYYTDYKVILQGLSVPLKFRKPINDLPYTTETSVNLALGVGIKYGLNWYNANKSFFGQKTNTLSFSGGFLLGASAVDVTADKNAGPNFKSTKEPIGSYGGFVMIGFNNINIGFIIGKDYALKDGSKSGGWFYDGKTWTGIAIGFDIIK
jgi:hypothetical protein